MTLNLIRRLKLALMLVLTLPVLAHGEPATPNILFILADDLAWSDLGCYGHPWHRTPNIDRLATQGMKFTNAYSPAPICSAARASILTGKSVPRTGFEFVTKNEPGQQQLDASFAFQSPPLTINLPLAEKTIAESLSPLGYETAFFGKWHVSQHYQRRYQAWHPDFGPAKQGFRFTVEDFGSHPYGWTKQELKKPKRTPSGEFAEDSLVEKSAAYLSSSHDKPYFAFASSFHVHTPVKNQCRWLVDEYESLIPQDAPSRARRLEYAAFLETFDFQVGRLLQAVEDSGDAANTVVVFFSDNGGHPQFTANGPLRGSKWNLYEGGIRVPFLVRWPGHVKAGSQCDVPVIGYDFLPTFFELAGGKADDLPTPIDGVSLYPLLHQHPLPEDRKLVWHFPYYHPESGFKKAPNQIGIDDFAVSQTRPQSAMRKGRYKVLYFDEEQRCEIYDLDADVGEQTDLSATHPDLETEMRAQLQGTLGELNARLALPR